MSVLLPTTTVHVLTPEVAVDAHGHAQTFGAAQRGPFDAALFGHSPSDGGEQHDRTVYALEGCLDPDAWPVRSSDRLLDATGQVYQVVGATQVPDLAGADLAHVHCTLRLIAET